MSINNYIADLNDVESKYLINWAIPYSECYCRAYNSFQKTVADQKVLNARKAEIFFMVASVGFGAGLAKLYGSAALKNVVLSRALQIVTKNNMNNAFNAMAAIDASAAAKFVVGKAWDLGAKYISNEAKSAVQSLTSRTVSLGAVKDPLLVSLDLQHYVKSVKSAAHGFAASVRDSDLSESEKLKVAEEIRKDPLITKMPEATPMPIKATEYMEQLMYMSLVMNSDFLKTTKSIGSYKDGHSVSTYQPIAERTDSPSYPSGSVTGNRLHGVEVRKELHFRRPGGHFWGSVIMDRTNLLYKNLFKTDFEVGGYGLDEVMRAEQATRKIIEKISKEVQNKSYGL